ncbi:phospholipid-transporting ATPase IA-like [Orbicella faveolata]|uniref:phospholipid-transporting ATPase IA-like n=1 Tax=Orbicella faveolata TaxID=48498 RepID=UPI0009E57E81|nr:phospholipid-transporting ATPase IA-like [Orbicella faveolata]
MELDTWNWLCHVAIWGSIASWFIFLLIYCIPGLALYIAPDMIGQDRMLYSCFVFWISLFIIPFITLLVDLLYKVFRRTFYKTLKEEIQEVEAAHGDPSRLIMSDHALHTRIWSRVEAFEDRKDRGASALGFAFSQEEDARVGQAELIRRYDTTLKKPRGD